MRRDISFSPEGAFQAFQIDVALSGLEVLCVSKTQDFTLGYRRTAFQASLSAVPCFVFLRVHSWLKIPQPYD